MRTRGPNRYCKRGHDKNDPNNVYLWNGLRYCRVCRGTNNIRWHKTVLDNDLAAKEYRRKKYLQRIERQFNLSQHAFEEIEHAHNGHCAICYKVSSLHLDHDHITNKIRGLICGPCNLLLGHANDSITTLQQAADYLELNNVGS